MLHMKAMKLVGTCGKKTINNHFRREMIIGA